VRIIELRDGEAINRLEAEWRALQAQCPDSTPFQTWEWNEAWWRAFGRHKRACLMLFYDSDSPGRERLVGIAPLYVSRHLGTPLRRLAWIGTGSSDYMGPLALPEFAEAVAGAMLKRLERDVSGWDIADLQHLRPSEPLARAGRAHVGRKAADRTTFPMDRCPYLPLPAAWDLLLTRLGKKLRSNIGYYDRLIQRELKDVRSYIADAASLQRGMSALFELHQKRWNARWLPGVLGTRRIQRFHREVAARFLAQGWLRLHLLEADGDIRSVLYCFAYNGRTYYYLGGFSPDLARYSLGTVLTAHAIRAAIEEGCVEFDFLRGEEGYKYRWQPEERVNCRLLLLRQHASLGGLGRIPGEAGLALNRVERFVVHRAKTMAARKDRSAPPVHAVVRQRTEADKVPGR
jgi:CelD/BcsL family acetyltransferase involved in cellulose biosynthesis